MPEKHHKVATIERERRARESVLSERESELKRKADRQVKRNIRTKML